MSLKAQLEAIIYATEIPITLDHLVQLVKAEVLAAGAADEAEVKSRVRATLEELLTDYSGADHGIEIRNLAGGYRMSTKPEQHDAVRAFAKSLKPPIRLSLPALETLAVIAYKQPVTVPEISEIRGVDSSGVIATLLDRKLITTAGRKAVIGRPILYKTSREFLLRFGLKDVGELPSMEEFEKLLSESFQSDLPTEPSIPEAPAEAPESFETAEASQSE
jgi:segregation and condensation protein B